MACRRFELCRLDDVSGVSGTGTVAEGVCFSTGKCVIEWLSRTPSLGIFDSVEELLTIHGHQGSTELVWLDGDDGQDRQPAAERCQPGDASSGRQDAD